MKLTDNLYAYVWRGNDNNCNSYIYAGVLNSNKHVLIDPGYIVTPYTGEKAYEMLTRQILQDGLRLEDIGMVLITHAHPDHIEATKKFHETSQALVALHRDDEATYKMFGGGKVDIYLTEGKLKTPQTGDTGLEIYHTPGHDIGEVCVYWPAKKALAAGDVVFYRNTGRVDLPGGSPGELKDSIEKLSKLDVDYLLCGHPYNNPGVIQGKEAVQKNFAFILDNIWF